MNYGAIILTLIAVATIAMAIGWAYLTNNFATLFAEAAIAGVFVLAIVAVTMAVTYGLAD